MSMVGPEGGYSAKDHLAHLTAWERGIVALLQKKPRFQAMGVEEAFVAGKTMDDMNEVIYQRNRQRPLIEVLADFEQEHRALLGILAGMDDADLFRPYSYYQPDEPGRDDGRPILSWIAGNTYEHFNEHAGWLRELRGKLAGKLA
jgi:hypothetical protein